ncbi:MAG TPA: CarD family transcriptional regulator, partial [Gemmatimonadaceae bacterium]
MALPRLLDAVEALPAFGRLAATVPAPGARLTTGGLPGSSDAALVATLGRRLGARRFLVVVTETLPDAERWLADLSALQDDDTPALYPPREGFGEVEPHLEVAGERVETLERVARGAVRTLITTARAVLERTRLPDVVRSARLELRVGDVRRLEDLVAHLDQVGFERVDLVDDVAQFSVRGGIVDIYSFGMANPVRLEFWGDEITSLRHFDILTQRSTRDADLALVLPVDARPTGAAAGAQRGALLDLVPPDTIIVIPAHAHLEAEMRRTWEEARHHIELARRRGEDVAPREALFQPPDDAVRTLTRHGTLELRPPLGAGDTALGEPDVMFPIRPPEAIDRDIKRLRRVVDDGTPTVILCDNIGQAERLEELLDEAGWKASDAALAVGVLHGGFVIPPAGHTDGLRVLTDHEIFRRERRIRRQRRYATGAPLETLNGLRPGDYVVHLEHGIGIFRGIEQVFVKESTIEAAVIEYEGGDRLNVPLYRIDQIERYRGAAETGEDSPPPRLHKLGGKRWAHQRDRTRAALQEMAVELLDLYARRRTATKQSALPDNSWQRQLESSFLFEDTPDQRTATEQVKRDMESPRPMDRLLVGDVGYGKTEVAVRAAFKAVQSARQAAILVPTTILAEQHGRTFGERLADFPVRVATLSRFQSPKEQTAILADLAAGKVDIVIGTHRL